MAITAVALSLVRQIFEPGYAYQKAGVTLLDLISAGTKQLDLFDNLEKTQKSQKLMQLLDATSAAMGHKTLYLAAEGNNDDSWRIKSEHRTPAYTTCWDSLPIAKA